MRTITFTLLFVFSELSSLVACTEALTVTDTAPCRARAWVRAPDLKPGHVIQGDVKVKLNGSCDEVSNYSLGLRFVERAWVKTRRENVTLPTNPRGEPGALWRSPESDTNATVYDNNDIWWDFWAFTSNQSQSAWFQYDAQIKDPALWVVREEERTAFETKFPLISDVEQTPLVDREIVKPFALLVPLTNYPPLFWTSGRSFSATPDDSEAEHIYQYFVDMTFVDGTHRQLEAGYTSFETVTTVMDNHPEIINVMATRTDMHCCNPRGSKCHTDDTVIRDNFTLEITFPNGRHFEQGSMNDITIVSHQLGPGLERPFAMNNFYAEAQQRYWWAAKHAADNDTAEHLLRTGIHHQHELRPSENDSVVMSGYRPVDSPPPFSQEGTITNDTTFSTEAVTAQFFVPLDIYLPFDMYFQTSVVELSLTMGIRNVSDNGLQPNGMEDEDEYDWTPEVRSETIHPHGFVRATIPIFVHRKPESPALQSNVVHYLSPEARVPVFVDPSSTGQLLQMTAEKRDNFAPVSEPKFVARADGEVVKTRYGRTGQYYVGNTWLRKVVARDENRHDVQEERALLIQA